MSKTIRRKKTSIRSSSGKKPSVNRVVFVAIQSSRKKREAVHGLVVCRNYKSLLKEAEQTNENDLWISPSSENTEQIAEVLTAIQVKGHKNTQRFGGLVQFEPPKPITRVTLSSLFDQVIGGTLQFKFLPLDQLIEVLSSPMDQRQDLFIGGAVNKDLGTLSLVRGNRQWITVPLSIFLPAGVIKPNFNKFSLDDYGHTLCFGNYESAGDVVLWEFDKEYRKRVKAKERNQATGIGASIRRLRIQRRLTQSDFPGVSRKTISRIENGEQKKIQTSTLNKISKILGVAPEELDSY